MIPQKLNDIDDSWLATVSEPSAHTRESTTVNPCSSRYSTTAGPLVSGRLPSTTLSETVSTFAS